MKICRDHPETKRDLRLFRASNMDMLSPKKITCPNGFWRLSLVEKIYKLMLRIYDSFTPTGRGERR